jgi:hypothetical protein
MDLDTNEPLNTLSPECVTWCKSIGSSAKTVNEAIADQAMLKVSYVTYVLLFELRHCGVSMVI